MVTPFRFIVSSQITMASEPSGKKWGPRLLPMMLLKISPVRAEPEAPMCWMLSSPRMVMGQLFMKLAPTVTTMLGAKIPRAEGSLLVDRSAEASRLVMPAVSKPLDDEEDAEHEEHDVPVDVPCQPFEPLLFAVHRPVPLEREPVDSDEERGAAADDDGNWEPVKGGKHVADVDGNQRNQAYFEQQRRNDLFSLCQPVGGFGVVGFGNLLAEEQPKQQQAA